MTWLTGNDLEKVLSESLDAPWYDSYGDKCNKQMDISSSMNTAYNKAAAALWMPSTRELVRYNIFNFIIEFP